MSFDIRVRGMDLTAPQWQLLGILRAWNCTAAVLGETFHCNTLWTAESVMVNNEWYIQFLSILIINNYVKLVYADITMGIFLTILLKLCNIAVYYCCCGLICARKPRIWRRTV